MNLSALTFQAFSSEVVKIAVDYMDEGWNDPPPPQSRKIPKRPKNAPWKYDPRPVWGF